MEATKQFISKHWWWIALALLFIAWWLYQKTMIKPGDMVQFIAPSNEGDAFTKGSKYKVLEITKNAAGDTLYLLQSGEIKGQYSANQIKKA